MKTFPILKSLCLMAALCILSSASAKTLYLNTGGSSLWSADNAKFAIWYWGNTTEGKWSELMTEDSPSLYSVAIDDDNDNVIFVRLNSTSTAPSWDNKWNQTPNLTIGSYDTFTITDWGAEGVSKGVWSNSQTGEVGYTTQAPANCPDIILQAFYYDSYNSSGVGKDFGDTRWATLLGQAPTLAKYFDMIWLPPSARSTGGTGYIPTQLSNQSGDWGSAEELHSLITTLHDNGAKVMADIVVNHLGNSNSWCSFYQQDFGEYGSFQPDATWVTTNDEMNYSSDAAACRGKATVSDDGYDGGQDFDGARDLAHSKAEVREMCKAYLKWLKNEIGYDAWRWDFGKGFHGSHENDYNTASEAYFSVIEYWDGVDAIVGKLTDASWNSYAFDFPTKYRLNTGIGDGNYTDLLCPGLICTYKNYAVTFVDNHDTFRREYGGSLTDNGEFMGTNGSIGNYANRTVQAYAFILSMPGVPCVFYPHYYSFPEPIKAMCEARHKAGVHSGSNVTDEAGNGYYKATVSGTNGGSIKLRIGPNSDYRTTPDGYTAAYVGENCGVYYVTRSDYDDGNDEPEPTADTLNIGFLQPEQWTQTAAYAWNDNGTLLGDWPGTLQTADDDGWIRIEIAKGAKIIFNNNGAGEQTVDSETLTDDVCLELGEKNSDGKYLFAQSDGCHKSKWTNFYLVGYINNEDLWDALPEYNFDEDGYLKTSFSVPAYVFLKNNKTDTYYMTQSYVDENSTSGVFFKSVYGEELYKEKMYAPAGKTLTYRLQDNSDGSYTLSYSDVATGIDDLPVSPLNSISRLPDDAVIYTSLGVRVSNKNLPHGVYIVRSADGKYNKIRL